jgi:hypothetical protein
MTGKRDVFASVGSICLDDVRHLYASACSECGFARLYFCGGVSEFAFSWEEKVEYR